MKAGDRDGAVYPEKAVACSLKAGRDSESDLVSSSIRAEDGGGWYGLRCACRLGREEEGGAGVVSNSGYLAKYPEPRKAFVVFTGFLGSIEDCKEG